jgi:hypothetical protein
LGLAVGVGGRGGGPPGRGAGAATRGAATGAPGCAATTPAPLICAACVVAQHIQMAAKDPARLLRRRRHVLLSLNNNHGHPTVAALPQRRTGARGLFEAFCASLLPTRTPLMGPFSLRPESDRNALTHYSSRQYRSGPSGLSGYRHEVIVTCPQLL